MKKLILKLWQKRQAARLQQRIFEAVESAARLDNSAFPDRLELPSPYGRGMPERAVELLLARLLYRPNLRVMDVGYANAMACHLRMLETLEPPANLTGLDIAEPVYDARRYYARAVRASVIDVPLPDESFDLIWCISTLEHVGMDNTNYVEGAGDKGQSPVAAVKEMIRLLAPGGRLLVTVPFGRFEDLGWMLNYDSSHLQTLLDAAPPCATAKTWYFRHTFGGGWTLANPDELRYVGYYDQANGGAGAMAAVVFTRLSGGSGTR